MIIFDFELVNLVDGSMHMIHIDTLSRLARYLKVDQRVQYLVRFFSLFCHLDGLDASTSIMPEMVIVIQSSKTYRRVSPPAF